jgi:hypothetical protein
VNVIDEHIYGTLGDTSHVDYVNADGSRSHGGRMATNKEQRAMQK